MATECYVTVHDQDLLLACEESGQFDAFSEHTYMFVGPRPVDRVPEDVRMVVCRDFEPNMEAMPQFYDFTGWWALAHHELIEADNVVFLQYDMHVLDRRLEGHVNRLLRATPGMVAFNAGYFGPNWMLGVPGFEKAYRAGLATQAIDPSDFPKFNEWPSTQGTAWRSEQFVDFMTWFEPMFNVFAPHIYAGHLAERTVKAWSVVNHPEKYLLGAIRHEALDCHGTSALMAGRKQVYEERNAAFMAGE